MMMIDAARRLNLGERVWRRRVAIIATSVSLATILLPSLGVAQVAADSLHIDSLSPDSGPQGEVLTVTVWGDGFTEETSVYLRRGTFTVNPRISFVSENELEIVFDVPINPQLVGPFDVWAISSDGVESRLEGGFTVLGDDENSRQPDVLPTGSEL
jgi:hypothetical protein